MKPVCITLTNSKSFRLYNKELNNLFDKLDSKLIGSGADLIYLQDDEIIPQLKKVLPRGLRISTISRETLVLVEGPDGFAIESINFIYYNDNCKKYTIKLL
jgi:hypothetical protein